MDSSNLNALISAFRNETEKNSISPDTVGYLLQLIVNLSNENNVTLENSINALLTAIDNIGDVMNEHEESISELRTISDSQSLDINALKKKADIAETALASAQANEENISSLAEKNTEQDNRLENLEEQDSMFASSISELSKENQRQAQDISKIVADVNNIGVVNINELANTTDYMTLETAISFLPEEMNCNGRIIVFKNSDSGTWDLYIKFIEGNDKSAWRVLYSESSLAEKNTEQDNRLENLEEQDSMFASSISELSKENQRQAQDISKIVADVNNIGVVNINELANTTDYMTLETAISFLPEEMNCNGRIIVFKNSDSGTWDLYIKFIEGNDKSAWRVLYSESSLAEKNTEQDAAIVALNRLIESNTTLLVELEVGISNLRDDMETNRNSITNLASSVAIINKDIYDINEAVMSTSQRLYALENK